MTPMTERQPGPSPKAAGEHKLEDLLPIAVVITGGCEPCAEKMVHQALERGSTPSSIARALRIVEHLHALDCLAQAVGPDVIGRMEKPLRAAQKALREADLTAEHPVG